MPKQKQIEGNSSWVTIYFDGGAEPNPGPASDAAILDLPNGESVTVTVTVGLGIATNNVAEYSSCIAGLKKALELGFRCAKIKGDSQLVINQLDGEYAVKAPNLLPLYLEAKRLLGQLNSYHLDWIPRAQNSRADAAAGEILNASKAPVIALPNNLPLAEPREGIRGKIERLNKQGEKASFKEVLALKSGKDTFSKLRGDALAAAVPLEVKEAIASKLRSGESADFVAKTYRWWLRGLTVALSLRKVRVDTEVAANLVRKKV